jgi:peptidoglycan/xylan/chitin deacetylase (PgdA/CDA1 family)
MYFNESCFLRYPDFKRKAVTLSYDDGTISDIKLIKILDEFGLKGTFNFTPNFINNWAKNAPNLDAVEFYKNCGHEIACHGEKHYSLSDVNVVSMVKDVLFGKEKLEEIFGQIISGMAYANGTYNKDAVDIVKKCGFHYSRTTDSTENFYLPEDWLLMHPTCKHTNPKLMELAKKFVEEKDSPWFWSNKPMLFTVWGHAYEFDNDNNWEVIQEFCKYTGGRKDVWYATNIQICDYVRAFHRLEYSADGNIIYNPTDKDIYLHYYNKELKVPKGQTVYNAKN